MKKDGKLFIATQLGDFEGIKSLDGKTEVFVHLYKLHEFITKLKGSGFNVVSQDSIPWCDPATGENFQIIYIVAEK